jgi:hypothetical protein
MNKYYPKAALLLLLALTFSSVSCSKLLDKNDDSGDHYSNLKKMAETLSYTETDEDSAFSENEQAADTLSATTNGIPVVMMFNKPKYKYLEGVSSEEYPYTEGWYYNERVYEPNEYGLVITRYASRDISSKRYYSLPGSSGNDEYGSRFLWEGMNKDEFENGLISTTIYEQINARPVNPDTDDLYSDREYFLHCRDNTFPQLNNWKQVTTENVVVKNKETGEIVLEDRNRVTECIFFYDIEKRAVTSGHLVRNSKIIYKNYEGKAIFEGTLKNGKEEFKYECLIYEKGKNRAIGKITKKDEYSIYEVEML